MLWPGSEAVNEPPEVLIVPKVAKFSLAEVRYRWNIAGTVPPLILNVWLTADEPVLTATILTALPDLNAAT